MGRASVRPTFLLPLYSNVGSRVAHKECALRGVPKPLVRFGGSARARRLPDLSPYLWARGRNHLIFWHAIDSRANTLDGDLITVVVGNGIAPLLELFGRELELVVFVAEDTVGAASGVGEARASSEVFAKVVIEAVVWGRDKDETRTVFAKDSWRKLLERGFMEMLDPVAVRVKGEMSQYNS